MKILILALANLISSFLIEGKLGLNVDYAVFRHSDQQNYLEIFYSVQKSKLTYQFKDGKYNISLFFRLDVVNLDKDSLIIRKGWKIETGSPDTVGTAGQDVVDVLRFYVPAGRYRVIMRGIDLFNTQNYDSVAFDVNVPAFVKGDKLLISSLEFCYSIERSTDTSDVFYKNSFRVVPNPTATFGQNVPVLYYYFELDVAVSDIEGRILVENRRKFFIFNPSVAPRVDTSKVVAQVYSLAESELDDEFTKASYIATQEERDFYKKLKGIEAKRRFLGIFWARRGGVEFRNQYLQRVKEADEKFTTKYEPGWKTDRGRVYIVYGPPDEV